MIRLMLMFIIVAVNQAHALDGSYLHMSVSSESGVDGVALVVTDPAGRATGPGLRQIPHSSYGKESIGDDVTGDAGVAALVFDLRNPSAGTYHISVSAIANSDYLITLASSDSSGKRTSNPASAIGGTLLAGASQQMLLVYNPAPNTVPSIQKAIDFNVLRSELQSSFLLNEIGDKRFVDSLDSVLADGQKSLTEEKKDHGNGGKPEAVNKLNEFSERIQHAAKRSAEDDRDQSRKTFVKAPAVQVLVGDSNALVQELGGKPRHDEDRQDPDSHDRR